MEKQITITEKQLVEAMAKASARQAKEIMEKARTEDPSQDYLGAALTIILSGAALASGTVKILFPESNSNSEDASRSEAE